MAKGPNTPHKRINKDGTISWYIQRTEPTADGSSKRRTETFEREKDAKLALARHQAEAEEAKRGLRRLARVEHSFDELCDHYLRTRTPQKRRPDNDESYVRSALKPAFGSMRIRDIGPAEIERFKTVSRSPNRAESTVNHHLTLLVSILRYAVDLGWLDAAPKVKKYRVAVFDSDFRYLRTADEIRRFLGAARDLDEENAAPHSRPQRGRCFELYSTAIHTGLRLGELVALRWDAIDFDRRLITVLRSHKGSTKAGDVRYVPLLDPLVPILRTWRLKSSSALVFPNEAGKMRDRADRVFREIVRCVLARAGFTKIERNGKLVHYITFHCLRHTFASFWMQTGGDLFKLQKILGHKTPAMTQRYAHLTPDVFAGDLSRFSALVSPKPADVIPIAGTR